ncbi:MAG: hypothetical protein KY476_18310, partial [Planctomycetes bacterium]|nr:hypothetical protein [Planctomycetota bacterium]
MVTRRLIFEGFDTVWGLVGTMAVVAAALVLIAMLLRYERRLAPRRVGNALVALRLIILGLLALVLLEPTLIREQTRDHTARIIVALDLSESMNTRDLHATPAEKLRWARAVKMVGGEGVDRRVQAWIEAYQSGREPELVDESEAADPERRRRLAEIRQKNLDTMLEGVDEVSRKELARRILSEGDEALLKRLEEIAQVEVVVFGGKAEGADARTLTKIAADPPQAIRPEATDLSQPLVPNSPTAGTTQLIGVVLFTDGRDNAGRNALGAASRLGNLAAPVAPVIFGSLHRPKDLAIASLEYPQTAFKDDNPLLKAKLVTAGFESEPLEVVLEGGRDGDAPQTKTIVPDGPVSNVEFELAAGELGRFEYTLRTDVRPGETRDDNNSKSFALSIVDDKVRVLLVEGEARWEFRFIAAALSRDERVQKVSGELPTVVFRQPHMNVLPDTFFPRRLPLPANADDLEGSPFSEVDLVILGDVAPGELSETGWQLLEKFVAESGGTLVISAGKNYMPLAYHSQTLERLLPVSELRPVNTADGGHIGAPTERGFPLVLTANGEREAMFQFDTDHAVNLEIWEGLPGHMWGLVGTARPGATVFAYAGGDPPVANAGPGAGLEAERQNALIVHQHYGFGQILWLGIDSTWRWRHRVGDDYHHRFWGQLGRWAAENKAAAGNEFVKFGPVSGDIEVGDDAVIRARWTHHFLSRYPNLKA